ncbi:hypothetical protein OsI_13134 [Oryza sativa Indica Group]|uniref:Water stress and hypersensitive response domain-containing protein n=1 Tax=Oryza sativa subsp. indica TaxID=39946 RepID=B8APZ2_ORYSI|nr:hypothetical protein OsI_13134 [Oryza sativa Indica Group]
MATGFVGTVPTSGFKFQPTFVTFGNGSVARLRLAHVSVSARPTVRVTISAALKVRVRNPDLFALDYGRLDVDIGYRGAPLGRVTSGGGRVRARAVSYIDANLSLDGISVVEDAIYLLEDLARGSVPFDTVAEVEGHVHLFFLSIPVKICLEKY